MSIVWKLARGGWGVVPERVRKYIRANGYLSPDRLSLEYGPKHSLPIKYEGLETNIPVRRSITSPWLNYDRKTRPYHEPLATATYIREIEIGDTVWDIGSRFGYETVIAATLNKHPERVHTFEMVEKKVWRLRRLSRLKFEGRLNVNQAAVGNISGDGQIRLDDYAREHGPPNFVTMDIETHEIPAILGMKSTIESAAPTLLIEWHGTAMDHDQNKEDIAMVMRLLRETYSSIQYSEDYRDPSASWSPLEVEVPRVNCQLLVKA
jgi:hypothetical protein